MIVLFRITALIAISFYFSLTNFYILRTNFLGFNNNKKKKKKKI